jgi:AcrR family transcriptional regulator
MSVAKTRSRLRRASHGTRSESVRRPVTRRRQIAAQAADLFRIHGFHNVTVTDIAAGLGISGAALYRHFRDKKEVLFYAIMEGLHELKEAVSPKGHTKHDLKSLAIRLAVFGIAKRGLGPLLQREARSLSEEQRSQISAYAWQIISLAAERVGHERPDVDVKQARLLTTCAVGLAMGPSYHHIQLPREKFETMTAQMIERALSTPFRTSIAMFEKPTPWGLSPLLVDRASRPEALLSVSVRLFSRSGYASVTMEDIGAAVGITGASVYNHYSSKVDLLAAAIRRGSECLQMGVERALVRSQSRREALHAIINSYANFAFDHNPVLECLISELHHLPTGVQENARTLQRDYVSEWAYLIVAERSNLDHSEARAAAIGAMSMLNDRARSWRFADTPELRATFVDMALAALLDEEDRNRNWI